ncbi:MAG: hypothetical protein JW797_08475 [Bradymonadales bacterium]|nr:hypothetical protein [Bradymonadales bacterium]
MEYTLDQVIKALPNLVKPGHKGKNIYNLEVASEDGPTQEMWLAIVDGQVSSGMGKSDDAEAVLFKVVRGGMETLMELQFGGLEEAIKLMMMGKIFTDNIPGAEAWFNILEIGEEPFKAAMAKAMA